MNSILALAVVGSWTYGGFLAEPAPVAPQRPPASAPILPEPPIFDPEPATKSETKPEPNLPGSAPATSASIPSRPNHYRLADASGQVWEHADPTYLRSFIDTRNRSFLPRSYASAPAYRASRCVNGRCP